MKSTTVKGTPVNRISPAGAFIGNREGFNAKMKPDGYSGRSGVVKDQYEGDRRGPDQVRAQGNLPPLGTPYESNTGNPDEAIRTRADHRYGIVLGENGQDMNNPSSNGDGVVFDGMAREKGYQPRDAATLDSPVMDTAPWFDTRTIRQENAAHMGANTSPTLIEDDLVRAGGVMSK